MHKSTTEQPIKKSKLVKSVEGYASLTLEDQKEAFDLIREIYEQSLKKEISALSQKRTENEELLELIKKP